MASKNEKAISFETALLKLESIVKEMEAGALDLDKMIAAFEEGQRLVTLCTTRLNEVEKKIEKIVKDNNGDVVVIQPLDLNGV